MELDRSRGELQDDLQDPSARLCHTKSPIKAKKRGISVGRDGTKSFYA
jgi:hypothetical protein